jgi:cation-transporting ATPase E
MDKTGTLTANRINYHDLYPISVERSALEAILGDFARSASVTNKTGEALITGLPGTKRTVVDEVAFASARKWSALAFDDTTLRGVCVLGAREMLEPYLTLDSITLDQVTRWSEQGLRVLVFAHNPDSVTLHDEAGEPALPPLKPLGLIAFSDELRPQLKETLSEFMNNGITLKVISGDNPQTVAALARQAGFPGDLRYVSGTELADMEDAHFTQVAAETTVFGRITPDQKEKLVDSLRSLGHYVAMIGDGVNDVLSLKKANMGIAMQSGSSATRTVADMILLNDSFGALPHAFTEGQRILNGMTDILRLFLTRVLYTALLIVSTAIVGTGFPYLPTQNALMVFLTVGIPTLFLAIWAKPGVKPRRSMLLEVAHFVVPSGLLITIFGLLIFVGTFYIVTFELVQVDVTPQMIDSFQEYAGLDYNITGAAEYVVEVGHLSAQTALTIFTTFAGLALVVFVQPPTQFFVGGDEYSGDWRPTIMAVALLLVFFAIMLIDPLRNFFAMIALPWTAYAGIGLVTLLWLVIQRLAWRQRWLERFLQIDGT